jgi:hypothetical protein
MQNRRGKGGLLECCKKEDEEKMVPLSGCFIRKRRGEKKSPYDGGGSQTVWGPVHDKQFLRSGIIRIGSSAARCSNRTCLVHVSEERRDERVERSLVAHGIVGAARPSTLRPWLLLLLLLLLLRGTHIADGWRLVSSPDAFNQDCRRASILLE